jgi:hypothetical protein
MKAERMTVEELAKSIDEIKLPGTRIGAAQLRLVLLEMVALMSRGTDASVSAEVLATLQGCVEVVNQQAGQIAALAAEVAELRDLVEVAEPSEVVANPDLAD